MSLSGCKLHRLAALRIGNVNVAHRRCDTRMTQNALDLRKMNSCLKQVRCAGMPKLMHTVNRYAGTARDRVNAVTYGTTDIAPGYDHITSGIGAAMSVVSGPSV